MPKKGKGRGRPKKRPIGELDTPDPNEQTTKGSEIPVEGLDSDKITPNENDKNNTSDGEDDMESVNLIEVRRLLVADDMDVDADVNVIDTDDSLTKADDSVSRAGDSVTEGNNSSQQGGEGDNTTNENVPNTDEPAYKVGESASKVGESVSKVGQSVSKVGESVSKVDDYVSKDDSSMEANIFSSKADNSPSKTDSREKSPSKSTDVYSSKADVFSSKADDNLNSSTTITTRSFEEPSGFRFIDINLLVNFVSRFPCPACFKSNLGHSDPKQLHVEEKKVGAACVLVFTCGSCGVEQSMTNSARAGPSFEVNARFQAAMYSIGNNNNKAKRFCSSMKMPEPTPLKPWMNRHA